MPEKILKFTRYVFIIQAFVGVAFGLVFVFFAEAFLTFENWPYFDPVFIRLLGLDFIGLAALNVLSAREKEYAKVKNVVIMEIWWTFINSVGFTVMHFMFDLPAINWTNIGSYYTFLIIYIIIYFKQKK